VCFPLFLFTFYAFFFTKLTYGFVYLFNHFVLSFISRISPSNTISLNNSSSASSSNSGVGSGDSNGSSITNCNKKNDNNNNNNSNIIINSTSNNSNHYTTTTHSISNKEWNERKNRNVLSPPDAKSIVGIISNGGDDSLEVVPPLQTTLVILF